MKKLILSIVLFINIVFCQDLTKEQEIYYNNNKIIIETKTSYFWFYWAIKYEKYFLYKGYDDLTLEGFAKLYGDDNLLNKISIERENLNKNIRKKWWYFGFGTSLLIFAQDDGGRVVEPARPFAIGSFVLFTFNHLKYRKSKRLNHHIIPINQVQDLVSLYNNRLMQEIKTGI